MTDEVIHSISCALIYNKFLRCTRVDEWNKNVEEYSKSYNRAYPCVQYGTNTFGIVFYSSMTNKSKYVAFDLDCCKSKEAKELSKKIRNLVKRKKKSLKKLSFLLESRNSLKGGKVTESNGSGKLKMGRLSL